MALHRIADQMRPRRLGVRRRIGWFLRWVDTLEGARSCCAVAAVLRGNQGGAEPLLLGLLAA